MSTERKIMGVWQRGPMVPFTRELVLDGWVQFVDEDGKPLSPEEAVRRLWPDDEAEG